MRRPSATGLRMGEEDTELVGSAATKWNTTCVAPDPPRERPAPTTKPDMKADRG